jgi:predicted CXXCH cytochrome family protein
MAVASFDLRRKVAPLLVASLALLAAPLAVSGQEVVVSYPPDMTLVEKADLPVEGYARNPNLNEVEIIVNDGRPQRAAVRRSVFAEEVSLDEGPNAVRVGTVVRRVWLASATAKPPAGYQRVYGHFGLDDGCLECHETDGLGSFTLSGEREEICAWCHGDIIRGRLGAPWVSVHAPVRAGKCLDCHDPHVSLKPGLPAAKPPGCVDCHADVSARLKADRFVHGPMNLGDCRLCHAVHASAQPKLLLRPATALCTDCHSDALPPAGSPTALQPHPMIPEGQCGRCHEPHSSENPLLLRQPAGRLCQGCHEGKTRSFHEAKGFSIYVCAKCHDLHRPDQPHLIIETSRSLCTACHDFRGEAVFTHSFVAEGKCFLCHSFHEAPLSAEIATLCLKCHRDNPRLPAAHRGISIEHSRCTGCHLPHQARRGQLLREQEHTPFKERSCAECHRDRAAKIGPLLAPLCTDCHVELNAAAAAAAAVIHPAFRDADCGNCHRSHNADWASQLRESEAVLCLGCHRKMRKAMLMAPVSAHSAVLEGRCGNCHDPHFSANDALLHRPQAELCPSCHAALVQPPGGGAWPVGHKPVLEGKCRLCHRSHTATNAKLLKAPSPQPCRPCHVEFFAAIEDPGLRSSHEPVKTGACGACHQLHGSDAQDLLKEGARGPVCRGCHPKPQSAHHIFSVAELQAKPGGSQAEANGCTHCHLPHASAGRRLLRARGDPVCRGCHPV